MGTQVLHLRGNNKYIHAQYLRPKQPHIQEPVPPEIRYCYWNYHQGPDHLYYLQLHLKHIDQIEICSKDLDARNCMFQEKEC